MKLAFKKITINSFLILLSWNTVSCSQAQETEQVAQKKNSEQNIVQPQNSQKNRENFTTFYSEFVSAIENDNWQQLSKLTKFPFTFRGQLDFEGELQVNQSQFSHIMPTFMEQETFVDLEGEAFPTTYRTLALSPMSKAKKMAAQKAEIHDFVFIKENNQWWFSEVYTDLSNVNLN